MGKGIIAGGAGGSSEELIHQLISVHNADAEAHEPIRNSISAVESTAQSAAQAANSKAPIAHAVNANTYGLGSDGLYGHVKLSASTSSSSGVANGYAATPSAVKAAYDLANTANTAAQSAQTTADSKAPMYTYGTDDLTAGTSPLATGQLHFVYE